VGGVTYDGSRTHMRQELRELKKKKKKKNRLRGVRVNTTAALSAVKHAAHSALAAVKHATDSPLQLSNMRSQLPNGEHVAVNHPRKERNQRITTIKDNRDHSDYYVAVQDMMRLNSPNIDSATVNHARKECPTEKITHIERIN